MGKEWSDDTYYKGHEFFQCFESHPALKIAGLTIYGGSCSRPVVKDADIYVALQAGSYSGKASDPWDESGVVEVHFSINDGGVPKPGETTRFKKMVDWLCNQLQAGKKVHVGCIGGHGRTGMVLAALVATLGEKDAITYVRKNYCDKAVETREQVRFLNKHFGVLEVKGSKDSVVKHYSKTDLFNPFKGKSYGFPSSYKLPEKDVPKADSVAKPLYGSPRSIWRKPSKQTKK